MKTFTVLDRISLKRALAVLLAAIVVFDGVATPLANANELETLWQTRRRAIADNSSRLSTQMAALLPALAPTSFEATAPFPGISGAARITLPAFDKTVLSAIPRNAAKINRVSLSNRPHAPLVILLQDVHLNTEAQTNMAKTLEQLVELPEKPLLAVEGAEGPFDFTVLRAFENEPLKHAIATAALEKNIISAPSYIGMTSKTPLNIVGVDDTAHYNANEETLRVAQRTKSTALEKIRTERAALEADKNRSLSGPQKDLDRLLRSREQNTDTLANHVLALEQMLPDSDNELIVEQFLAACRLEKDIDFAQADREKQTALRMLTDHISAEEKIALLQRNDAYQAGAMSFADHLNDIHTLFERHHLDLKQTPQFAAYLQYVLLADRLDAEQLLTAVKKMEQQALTRWVSDDAQKQLFEESRALYLREKLVAFALTPDEWDEYKKQKPSTETIDLSACEKFYVEADIRSEKMVENLSSIKSPSFSILIIGGFHTPRVARLLRDRGISTAVVQPLITHVDNDGESSYLSIFTRDKTPLEKLLDGEKLFLAPPQPLVGRPGKLANANLMRVVIPQALADNRNSMGNRITKQNIGDDAWRVNIAGVGAVTVTTHEIFPKNLHEIQQDVWPLFGTVRYLMSTTPVNEFPWLTVPVLSLYAGLQFFSVPFAWQIAVAVNALCFAAVHNNQSKGRFNWRRFAIRTVASLEIMAVAGAWFDPTASLLSFIGFALITIALHAIWNRFAPASLQLQMAPERIHVSAGQEEQLALVKKELQKISDRSGLKKLYADEQNALRLYLLRKYDVTASAPLPRIDMSPRIVAALQNYEYAEFQKSSHVKTSAAQKMLARLESVVALKKASPDDRLLANLDVDLKNEWDAYLSTVLRETDFRRYVALRRDTMYVIKRIGEEALGDETGLRSDLVPLLLEQLREKSLRLSEKQRLGAYRAAVDAAVQTLNRPSSTLTTVLNTNVVDMVGRVDPDALKSVIDRLSHALSSSNNGPLWDSRMGLRPLVENVLHEAQMLYSFVRGPTVPFLSESTTPRSVENTGSPNAQAPPANADASPPDDSSADIEIPNPPAAPPLVAAADSNPSPTEKTGLKRETLQRIAFYSTVALITLLVAMRWTWVVSFLQWTNLAYFANGGAALASSNLHLSFTNVTASLAVIEFMYRLIYVIARKSSSWIVGSPENVRFSTLTSADYKGEPDTLLRVERFDGVEVDFTSNAAQLQKAIANRFFRYAIDASDAEQDQKLDINLNGLDLAQLRRLYYLLDKQDGVRKEKADQARAQRRAHAEEGKAFNVSAFLKKLTLSPITIVMETIILCRDLFFRTQIARWRYGVSGRFENNYAVTVNTAYRKNLKNGAADAYDAWATAAVDQVRAQAEQIINEAIKTVEAKPGMGFLRSVARWSVVNNIAAVGFVAYLLRRIPITITGAIGGLFLSPIGFAVIVSVPLALLLINGLRRKTRLSYLLSIFATGLLTLTWIQRDTIFYASLEDLFKRQLFPAFTGLQNLNDVSETQNFWWRGLATTREFLTPVAHHLQFTVKAFVSSMFTALGLGAWQTLKRLWRARSSTKFLSASTFTSAWNYLSRPRTWGQLLKQTKSMWFLGGEIALGVETAGMLGHAFGGVEGETVFRGAVNLLEGERDSAMSVIQDLQNGAIGYFGLVHPPQQNHSDAVDVMADANLPVPNLKIAVEEKHLDRPAEPEDKIDGKPARAEAARVDPLKPFADDLDRSIKHMNGGFSLRSIANSQISYLYDMAMAAQAALSEKNLDEAASLATRPWETRSNVRVKDRGGLHAITAPVNAVDADTGRIGESKVDTGSILHDGLSALSVLKQLPIDRRNGVEGRALTAKIKQATAYASAMRTTEGGFRQGPIVKIGFPKEQNFQFKSKEPRLYDNFATEHQLDAYAFFSELARQSGNRAYQQIADDALAFAIRHNWDPVAHRFRAGFLEIDGKIQSSVLYPTDAQTWAISMVGVEKLISFVIPGEAAPRISANDIGEMLRALDREHAVRNNAGLVLGIRLFGQPRKTDVGGSPIISIEWTAQTLAAKLQVAKYLKANPAQREKFDLDPTELENEVRSVAEMLAQFKRGENGGLYYAHNIDGSPAQNVPTGFGWNTQTGESLISAIYLKSVLNGLDPVSPNSKNFVFPDGKVIPADKKAKAENAAAARDAKPIDGVDDTAWVAQKNWALRTTEARQKAEDAANATNHVVEIPTVPVDRNGIPIKLVDQLGNELDAGQQNPRQIFLGLKDGKPVVSLANAMQPGSPYFDPVQRRFLPPDGTTFAPLLEAGSATMRDISGRVIPADGFFVHPSKDVHDPLWLRWKDPDGNITASFPEGKIAAPVDPDTKNDLLLGVDKARAESMTDAQIENFAALTQRRINEPRAVAFIVDQDFKVTGTIATLEEMQTARLHTYMFGPIRDGTATLEEYDPLVHPSWIPDVVKMPSGKRVFFTIKADEAKIGLTRLNAERAQWAARAAWGQRAWANGILNVPVMTAIQIKNQNGQVLETRTVRNRQELEAAAQQLGLKDLDKSFLLNTGLEFPPDPGRLVAVPPNQPQLQVVFTQFDHPDFPEIWMGLALQEIASHQRVGIKLRPGLVEPEAVDLATFERGLNANEQNQWRRSMALVMPDGSTVVRRWLAYDEDKNGEPTRVYDDPLEVYRLLHNPELLYEIPDGLGTRRVPFHLLPENPTVLALYEPDGKKIVLGGAWNAIQAGMNANARAQIMEASNGNPVARAIEMRVGMVSPIQRTTLGEVGNLELKKNSEDFEQAFARALINPISDQFILSRFTALSLMNSATKNRISIEEMFLRELRSTQNEGGLVPHATDNLVQHANARREYLNVLRSQIARAERVHNAALARQLKLRYREAVETQSYVPSSPTPPEHTYKGHETRVKENGIEAQSVFEYRWVFLGDTLRVFLIPGWDQLQMQAQKDQSETTQSNQTEEARRRDGGVIVTSARTGETQTIAFNQRWTPEQAAAEQAASYKKLRDEIQDLEKQQARTPTRQTASKLADRKRSLEFLETTGFYKRPNGDAAQIIPSWTHVRRYAENMSARFKPAEARRYMEDFLAQVRVDAARRRGASAVVTQTDANGNIKVITDPAEVDNHIHALEAIKSEKMRDYQKEKDPAVKARLAEEIQRFEWHIYNKDGQTFVIENFPVRQKELHDLFLARMKRNHQKGGDDLHRYTLFDDNNHAWGLVETDDNGNGRGSFYKTTVASVVRFDPVNKMTLIERRTYGRAAPPTKNQWGALLSVQQDWVDSEERSVSHLSGHVEKDGAFIPMFITNDTFSNDKQNIDDVLESRTHPISDTAKLRRSDYNPDVAPLLDSSRLIGKLSDVASGKDWMDLLGNLSDDSRKNIRGVIEPLKAKADRVIEVRGANGSVYRSIVDQTGRVLAIFEGAPGFIPLRLILNHYDTPALAAFQIASSSTLYDMESGRSIGGSKTLSTFEDYLRSGEIIYELTDDITHVVSWEVKNTSGERVRTLSLKLVVGADGKKRYVPFNFTLPLYSYGPGQHGAWGLSDHDFTFATDERGRVIDPETGAPLDFEDRAALLDKLAKNKLPYFEATRIVMRTGEGHDVRVIYESVMRFDDEKHTTAIAALRVKDSDGHMIENQLGLQDGAGSFVPLRVTLNALHDGPDDYGRFKITDISKTFTVQFFPAYSSRQPFVLNALSVGEDASVQIFDAEGKLAKTVALDANAKKPVDLSSTLLGTDTSRVRIVNRRGETLTELLADETSWLPTQPAVKNKIALTGFPVPPAVDAEGRLHYYREKYSLDARGRRIVQHQFLDYVAEREWRHSFNLIDNSYGELSYDDKRRAKEGVVKDQAKHPSMLNPMPHGGSEIERTRQYAVGVAKNPFLPDLPAQTWQVDDTKNGRQWVNVAGKKAVETTLRSNPTGENFVAVTYNVTDQDSVSYQTHALTPGKNELTVEFAAKPAASGMINAHDSDFIYVHIEAAADSLGQDFPWVMVFKDKSGKTVRVGANESVQLWNTKNPDKQLTFDDEKNGQRLASVALHSESSVKKEFVFAVPIQQLAGEHEFNVSAINPNVTLETNRGPNDPSQVRISSVMQAKRPVDQRSQAETLVKRDQADSLVLDRLHVDSKDGRQTAVYDGESNEENIIDIPIRDAGGRLLARMNIFIYPDDQTGRPREKRVLILYDGGAQPHPLGMVEWPDKNDLSALDFEKLNVRPYSISQQGNKFIVYETNPLLPASVPVVRTYNTEGATPNLPTETSIGEGLDLIETPSDIGKTAQGINNNIFVESWGWIKSRFTRSSARHAHPVSPVSRADLRAAFERLDKSLLTRLGERLNQEYEKLPANKRPETVSGDTTSNLSLLKAAKGAAMLGVFATVSVAALGLAVTMPQWIRRGTKKLTTIGPMLLLGVATPFIFLGLLPIFTPVYDYFWSRWFEKNKKIPDVASSEKPEAVADEALRLQAMTRYAERVQGRLVRDKDLHVLDMTDPTNKKKALLITGDEDIEGAFIQSAIDIYVTCYAGLIKWRDADPAHRAASAENKLKNLDGFVRAVDKAMAREWGRGNPNGRYKAMGPYDDPSSKSENGKYNPQVWNELNKLLFTYHSRLKASLVENNSSGPFLAEFQQMFVDLIEHTTDKSNGRTKIELLLDNDEAEQLHPVHAGVVAAPKYIFNMNVLRSVTKERGWTAVPALTIIMARHLMLRLAPVFIWSLLFYGGNISTGAIALNPIWIAVVVMLGALTFTVGAWTESRAILKASTPPTAWTLRAIPAVATLSGLLLLFFSGSLAFTGMAMVGFLILVFAAETASLLLPQFFSFGGHRSLFGVAVWIVLRPPAHKALPQHYLLLAATETVFLAVAVMLTTSIFFPWAADHYAMLEFGKTIGASVHFILMLLLLHKALNYHVRFFFTLFDLFKERKDKPIPELMDKAARKKVAINFVSINTIRSQIFYRNGNRNRAADDYKKAIRFRLNYAPTREAFLMLIRAAAEDPRLDNAERRHLREAARSGNDAEIETTIVNWMLLLWDEEERSKKSFYNPEQLWDERMPDDLRFGKDLSKHDKARIENVHHLMRALHEVSGMILIDNSSIDVAYNFCDLAISARQKGHADKTVFNLVNNLSLRPNESVHDPHSGEDYSKTGELQQRMYLAELLKYLSADEKGENGAEAYVIKVHTAQGTKAGALNGPMLLPESFKNVGQSVIVDVNSTALDTDLFWEDQELMWNNPNMMAIVAQRNVPGRENAILDSEYVAEGGHYMNMRSGGRGGAPVTGSGWGNTVRVQFWDNLAHHAEPDARVVSMDPRRSSNLFDQLFGLMGLPYQ